MQITSASDGKITSEVWNNMKTSVIMAVAVQQTSTLQLTEDPQQLVATTDIKETQ